MYETNIARIERRINEGLRLLREHYELRELPVGIFESFTVAGRRHAARQFEIVGVGNLLVMTNPDPGPMQMDTFTITPYYKNLPLFTTDYMYFEDRRMFLNEIYDLVEYKDGLYNGYISAFAENCAKVSRFEDMPMRACWYDSIRPVVAGKITYPEDDDEILGLFLSNLQTFIEMEQATPLLTGEHISAKWEKNYEYARALVEEGGVSTELFVKSLGPDNTKRFFYSVFFAPDRYRDLEAISRLCGFFDVTDSDGVTNGEKVGERQRILRRLPTTDKSKSCEAAETAVSESEYPSGVVVEDGRLIGFGIHIFNEDVYPLQSFEIYLRSCDLTGELDLTGAKSMVFLDVYHNRISAVKTGELPSMRIFGVQDNRISGLDLSGMPALQGVDAGMNDLSGLDVSHNPELVELYINDNAFTEIDLSGNPKLKYFYCHNNGITRLDTRANPLLRHLNATGNPMKVILCLAPQHDDALPLEVCASDGGTVGLRFEPVYNAQWKETGEWRQVYYACPDEGFAFDGWYDPSGGFLSGDSEWEDTYGKSRVITARFKK